jgi:hypothetical protein
VSAGRCGACGAASRPGGPGAAVEAEVDRDDRGPLGQLSDARIPIQPTPAPPVDQHDSRDRAARAVPARVREVDAVARRDDARRVGRRGRPHHWGRATRARRSSRPDERECGAGRPLFTDRASPIPASFLHHARRLSQTDRCGIGAGAGVRQRPRNGLCRCALASHPHSQPPPRASRRVWVRRLDASA